MFLLAACQNGSAKPRAKQRDAGAATIAIDAAPVSDEDTKVAYAKLCAPCHGAAVQRGEAPHLANPRSLDIATDSFIRYAIEFGRPATKMPAFGAVMTAQQIDDVTAYVRTIATAVVLGMLPEPTGKEPLVLN